MEELSFFPFHPSFQYIIWYIKGLRKKYNLSYKKYTLYIQAELQLQLKISYVRDAK